MSIRENPNEKIVINKFPFETRPYVVQCDFCHAFCDRSGGEDPGRAGEVALSRGFTTVSGKRVFDPKKWCCPTCLNKKSR